MYSVLALAFIVSTGIGLRKSRLATLTMSIRMVRDFLYLHSWEKEVLNRGVRREGVVVKMARRIPWSGVAMFIFVMVFFGVDLGAGMKHTASQIRDKKEEAKDSLEIQKVQARQWSVDQVKNFREGDIPKPSWTEGGPRSQSS